MADPTTQSLRTPAPADESAPAVIVAEATVTIGSTRVYAYKSVDRSVLCAWLMERVWRPALRWVPERTHPNTLTLIGNVCALAAFGLVLAVRAGAPPLLLLAVAGLLFVYLSLDNMDGAQARRTGLSSPLGEFFDHWGDGFNLGTTVLGFALMTRLPSGLTCACLGAAVCAYFATMWEQRRTGCLYLGAIGVTEGVLGLCGLYVAMALTDRAAWLATPGPRGVAWIVWLALAAGAGMAGTVALTIARVRRELADWWPLAGTLAAVGLWLAWAAPPAAGAVFVLIALIPRFGGRQIIARLTDGERRRDAPVLIAALVAEAVWMRLGGDTRIAAWLGRAAAGYLAWSVLSDGFTTWRRLRSWTRPDAPS